MARMTGSWLSGPSAALPQGQQGQQDYPGQWLGLPENGPGSLVPALKRVLALVIDWFTAMGVAMALVGDNPLESPLLSAYTLIIWFAVGVLSVTFFSFTPGQYIAGIHVVRVDTQARVGILRALARQALLVFLVPAIVNDVDGRGLHDRSTGTALVRLR